MQILQPLLRGLLPDLIGPNMSPQRSGVNAGGACRRLQLAPALTIKRNDCEIRVIAPHPSEQLLEVLIPRHRRIHNREEVGCYCVEQTVNVCICKVSQGANSLRILLSRYL